MAWLTLFITGPGGYTALDSKAGEWLSWLVPGRGGRTSPSGPCTSHFLFEPAGEAPPAIHAGIARPEAVFSRRIAIMGGIATAAVFLLGLVPRPSLSAAASSTTTRAPANPTPGTNGPVSGTKIASTSQVATNSGLAFTTAMAILACWSTLRTGTSMPTTRCAPMPAAPCSTIRNTNCSCVHATAARSTPPRTPRW